MFHLMKSKTVVSVHSNIMSVERYHHQKHLHLNNSFYVWNVETLNV